jgi:hypothetical protein
MQLDAGGIAGNKEIFGSDCGMHALIENIHVQFLIMIWIRRTAIETRRFSG